MAVAVRILYATASETSQGWGSQVLVNANVALNLSQGNGYVETLPADLGGIAPNPTSTVPWEAVRDAPEGTARTPIPYYLPGYPYIVSTFWRLTGSEGYISAQVLQALADSIIGCLACFAILAAAGSVRAGLIAAAAYAVALPAVLQSALILPDSLSNAANLSVLTATVAGFALRRPLIGAAAAGFLLGAGSWLRGDAVLLLPFLVVAVLVAAPVARAQRATWATIFVASWAVPSLVLAAYYQLVYDEFHLTRPGVGILLWESIGQQENPWGIAAPEGGNLDTAAATLTNAHGLPYGYWRADEFLRTEAISHMQDRPGWFVEPTLRRFARVVTLAPPPEAPSSFSHRVEALRSIAGPMALVVSLAGLVLLRGTFAGTLLVGAWLSRALPFSFLRDELRFEALIVVVYVILGAVVIDRVLTAAWLWHARRSSRRLAVNAPS